MTMSDSMPSFVLSPETGEEMKIINDVEWESNPQPPRLQPDGLEIKLGLNWI